MNSKLKFCPAAASDLPRIAEIIRQAQAAMRAAGSRQWQDGYPAPAHLAADIARGCGYVLRKAAETEATVTAATKATATTEATAATAATVTKGGAAEKHTPKEGAEQSNAPVQDAVIAYGAVIFDSEPAYGQIEGRWLTDGDYVVLHRLAVAEEAKGRGVATEFLRRIEVLARARGVGALRVDTNFDNLRMLHILRREGFVPCGKIHYEGGERLAFEKRL